MRENTRHYHTMSFDTARHKLKQLEAQMIQARRLRCVDDIFFLTWDEAPRTRARSYRLAHSGSAHSSTPETLPFVLRAIYLPQLSTSNYLQVPRKRTTLYCLEIVLARVMQKAMRG